MSLHKLTAGSGYDYLTRQIAALDATDKGHTGLASYYTEKGETPGVWVGSGMEGIDGLDAGDFVTADHMQNLFGAGHHPLATERAKKLDLRIGRADVKSPTEADYKSAARLGTPYKVFKNDISAFRIEVATRLEAVNEAAGLPGDWPIPAAERAKIRTEVAREFFRTEHGREPAQGSEGARELAATIAKHSRPKTNAVAGYDLTFSPVKSVSTLWAIADPKTAAVIECAHQAAIKDALNFIETKALFTRQGTNGVRQVNVRGLVATAFTHRDSRAGDPDLHTHHAVGVSLHHHGHSRYHDALGTNRPIELNQRHSPYAVPPTTEWIRRMAVSETAAGRYLDGRFTQALRGEASRPIEDDTRISRALAGWDIKAHRTLAADAWPSNMVLIARTQSLIADAAMVLVDAAQLAGHLEHTDRLSPAITEAGRAWSNLASRWGDLTAPDARLDPALMRAAAEVRAAYRELTHDASTMASLDVIATRPGLERGTRATLHALEAGSELAYVVAEKAITPGLTGPARALSIRAHNDIELGLAAPHPDGDVVWVSPADILAQRSVPVPRPVREALRTASTTTASAASSAAAPAVLAQANRSDHLPVRLLPPQRSVANAPEDAQFISERSPGHGAQRQISTGCADRSEPGRPLR